MVMLAGSGLSLSNSPTDSSNNWTLSQTINQELSYEFNDSSVESVQQFLLTNLTLSTLNVLNLSFIVEGDKSTSAGISVSFQFQEISIDFIIERIYQDNANHSISQSFFFDHDYNGNTNITVVFFAIASFGKSGTIRISSNSEIQNLPLITLTESDQDIPLLLEDFMFEGEMLGTSEYEVLTVFNCTDNITYSLELSVNFTTSDFSSFVEELSVSINSQVQDTITIDPNQDNNFVFTLSLEQGINILNLIFHIEISIDVIQISNLKLTGKLVPKINPNNQVFQEINWENEIDSTIDISSFKPISIQAANILNFQLIFSFEGTKIYSGIDFEITQNGNSLETGTISVSKQSSAQQSIELSTYTEDYNSDLFLHLSATNSGSGTIFLYNTSSIIIFEIIHFNQESYKKQLVSETEISTPVIGAISESFYDVVYLEESAVYYSCNFSMFISSDINFDSITITIKSGNSIAFTKSIKETGQVEITGDINLYIGYNELTFVITIVGQGATVTFQQIEYTIFTPIETGSPNPGNPTDPLSIPFFKAPENIIVGVFVLFNCWILMGIFLRIYRGRKNRRRYQTEND
ncbi:MAG: hypothetical protein KAS47_05070, partial [Candidatus Heimdallarchaeota archaeon]|nr:hypothetical protein [Candidatus Heimdallarchaeota archaeon]